MLEHYNSDTCTFFTPVREMRISPWEMQWVSGRPIGEFPYEEHVLPSVELELLKEQDPELYSTFWEVLCHYSICERLKGCCHGSFAHFAWAEYLFPSARRNTIGMPSIL